jgi:hypothetical protein
VGEYENEFHIPKNQVANDFGDYWFLRIADSGLAFHRQREDFHKTVRAGTWLLIGGINRLSFVLHSDENAEEWAKSFRVTKVAGAQWIPIDQLPRSPPSLRAISSCIYDKAPSFGGLSGSPIIGSDLDPSTGKPRLFVVGLHLRSGIPDPTYESKSDCGSYPGFNIGLALNDEILQHAITEAPR